MTTPKDESTIMIFNPDPPPNREPEYDDPPREPMNALDYLFLTIIVFFYIAIIGAMVAAVLWWRA
jgi:VanZ family protein